MYLNCCPLATKVSFIQLSYWVNENELPITLVLSKPLPNPVVIQVTSMQDTAVGKSFNIILLSTL